MVRRKVEIDDVAIVGAGLAGLSVAYRLGASGRALSVYDARDGVGGRLGGATFACGGGVADLGAYSHSDAHVGVCGLADHLGVARTPIEIVRRRTHLGVTCEGKDEADAGARLLAALDEILPGLTREWPWGDAAARRQADIALRSVQVGGAPLHDWGLRTLLFEAMGARGFATMTAGLGSDAAFANVNAYDAISTLLWEAHPGQRHFRMRDGYGALADALVRRLGENVRLRLAHRLCAVARDEVGVQLTFRTQGRAVTRRARAVVLAVPRRPLETLARGGDVFGAAAAADFSAVEVASACKLFLRFDTSWWRAPHATMGAGAHGGEIIDAAYTDLPMRQCYFPPSAPDARGGVVMAAYADGAAYDFWAGFAPRAQASAGPAPERMIAAALAQLRALFPDASIPAPVESVFVDWGRAPHDGAWHAWRPGVRSWEVRERLRKPVADLPLFVCGEAFAQRQGWCEGALNNAEMMLERHFGLSRPDWARSQSPLEY